MRRIALALVLLVGACSSAGSEDTTTTASGATTTSGASQSLVPGGLVPADPATLIPYEEAEPIVVGVSHRGVVSTNGRWAAIVTEKEAGVAEINIIDLQSLEIVRSAEGSGDGLAINDDGLAAWFDGGYPNGLLPDSEWPDLQYAGPVRPELSSTLHVFDDGRISYLVGGEASPEDAALAVVIGSDTKTIPLEGISAGPISRPTENIPATHAIVPAVAWDESSNRAFVVSATDNVIVAVDLASGTATSDRFDAAVTPGPDGVGRDAYVTAGGEVVLIASRSLEVEGDSGDEFSATDEALDLTVFNTTDSSASVLTQSIWALEPSLDHRYVAGTGASITWTWDTEPEVLQSPVYLIDGVTGEPLVGFEGRSGTIVDTQFSADSTELYVISENDEGTTIDIVDLATEALAGSLGFNRISLIGPAGLIAFHVD